ncbi:hypothetical protein HUJ05_005680 [Dendroctonus ponderosae]|nr:hypothetical protein HUJ05_005680 [Dendroctonus ponderosae]
MYTFGSAKKMFTKLALLSAVVAVALSAPAGPVEPVPILKQTSDIQPDGSFQWNYESGDGTKQEQVGSVKAGPTPDESIASVQGSASWVDPEGNPHEVTYVADENGFQAQSADIPVPPEIPAQIARALAWIAAQPQTEPPKSS